MSRPEAVFPISTPMDSAKLAVIIPCFNEEVSIAKVVRDAHKYLPDAGVFVFDNNSTDRSVECARTAGAHVIRAPIQGKGHVVRQAFRDVDADIYLLIDGDDTYPLEEADRLISQVEQGLCAMAVGTRLGRHQFGAFRRFHVLGNRIFSMFVGLLFDQAIDDMLSGYRALSRDLVDQLCLHSSGFEIETDLTLQTISKGFAIKEVPISYRARPAGSFSKLNTYRDGFFILKFILKLVKDYRPLPFFALASFFCFWLGAAAGWAPISDYVQFSYVYTVPRAILAASLMILSFIFLGVGLILDSQIRSFNDQLVIVHRLIGNQKRASPYRKAG